MSADDKNLPDNIRHRFPNLKPLDGVPSLFTLNGFGLSMYGKRDFDAETQTYIKTRCICALFVPLFALGSYRVADAETRSWYFFGRESLSNFARSWNIAMGCILVFLGMTIGWSIHTASPEYKARLEMTEAGAMLKTGEPLKAAGIYRRQLQGPMSSDARQGLKQSLEVCLQSEDPQKAAAALRMLSSLPQSLNKPPLVADAPQRGMALVAKIRPKDPESALNILNEIAALDPKNDALKPLRVELLKEIVAAKPDNTNRVVELALSYEGEKQIDESVKVLLPCRGATEGARILGQHLLAEGKNDEAYPLLFPYVHARLEKLRQIESSYTNTIARIHKRALEDLRSGQASEAFYAEYDKAAKTRKEQLVDDYIQKAMARDSGYARAISDLKLANEIVPVALDLGIVQLNRAQQLKDTARRAELEAAEKTFLSVRGFAGETDEYRMFLGQVYYWLGKSVEGKQLFDELLTKHQRAFRLLMSLAHTLREVGESNEARALTEEAYRSAKTDKDRFMAAALRQLIYKDTDDQIAWLEKSDQADNWIQIELNSSRGKRALQQGDKQQAATYLQTAISGYEKLPKTAGALNNCALACLDLYRATGDLATYERGMTMMDEAITLAPGDSILLHNVVYQLVYRAVGDVTRDKIHPELLGEEPSLQLLGHLYQNELERTPLYQSLRANESMKKGLAYLDKALLLAPKNRSLYGTALSLYAGFRDAVELQKLQERFRAAAPEFQELREETLKRYSGQTDKKDLAAIEAAIKKYDEALQSTAVRQQPLTHEHALTVLVGLHLQRWSYGSDVDSAGLLRLALAADQQHRSANTLHALREIYFFCGAETLAKQSAEFAALRERGHRSIVPEHLITLILRRGGPMAELARKNENVLHAKAIVEQIRQHFPSWVTIEEWAFLGATDPQTAPSLAENYKANKAARIADELQFEYNPVSTGVVLEQYWTQKLLGDEKHATEIYQKALREGVPLPGL